MVALDGYNFIAIDFETANNDRHSACQVGLVAFKKDQIVDECKFEIRPTSDYFLHTRIHGITWSSVRNEATFGELWPDVSKFIERADFFVAHNASFDKSVMKVCCGYYGLTMPDAPWICTFRDVARRLWPDLENYQLQTVCQYLDIDLVHHDGLSDARACAKIVLAAYEEDCKWLK